MSEPTSVAPGGTASYVLDEETNELVATLHFAATALEASEECLDAHLRAAGFGGFYPDRKGRKALVKALREINRQVPGLLPEQAAGDGTVTLDLSQHFPAESLRFVVAERRDASIEVSVSKSELECTLSVSKAWGGQPATLERLREQLVAAGVSTGIDEAALNAALDGAPDRAYVVARGRDPVDGEPAAFEALVESVIMKAPTEDARGKVDHRDRVGFVTVHPGDALMRRKPPTPGRDGFTVLGSILPARPGEDTPFEYNADSGTAPDSKDPNLLVARSTGHPVISATGVRIDPTLEVDRVNLRTGNINFEGSLLVREEIADGFRVEVGGDVFVGDSISKVQIIAGGNVQILHGCIGGDPDSVGKDEQGNQIYPTRIECRGSFTARFVSLAEIRAGEMVMVEEYIRHCRIVADEVLCGLPDGKGIVQGGHLKAHSQIVARVFGNPGGVPTLLEVGDDSRGILESRRSCRAQERALREKLKEVNRVGAMLLARARATGATPELREKLLRVSDTRKHLGAELERIGETLRELAAQFAWGEASITAYDTFHPNVQLVIDGITGKIRIERNNCTYRLRDGKFMRRRAEAEEDGTEPEAEIDDIAEEAGT